MDYDKTIKEVHEDFEKTIIPTLSDYIRIDNLSPNYDPEWKTNGKQEKAAELLLNWAMSQGIKGMKGEIIKEENRTPLIFLEIEPQGSDKNVLLYGHFDKQPHLGKWAEGLGPTTPVIKNGNLYGRGASDDGYAIFAIVESIKTIQTQGGKHGKICVTVEGGEESGSPDLVYYLTKLKDRIGDLDLMVCMDSGCKDYDAIWLTTSLRGVCIVDLTIECLNESVHSGSGSGIAPDSFTVLRLLLDRLDDAKTSKVLAPIHVDIPDYRIEDAKKLAELQKEKCVHEAVKLSKDVKALTEDYAEIILNNTWRPTVVVTGMSGFPSAETAGNVLRAKTSCRISIRLPPTFNCKKAQEIVLDILRKDPPYNAKITATSEHAGNGWAAKDLCDSLKKSFNSSSQKLFGKDYFNCGEGGSIPFINSLAELYPKCEIVVTGVLGPESNAHCLNECLNLKFTENMIVALAHAINDYCA
jgi:acetylornithine deacetylase/succinyl-diaminopimelate desuccinylase-like protein